MGCFFGLRAWALGSSIACTLGTWAAPSWAGDVAPENQPAQAPDVPPRPPQQPLPPAAAQQQQQPAYPQQGYREQQAYPQPLPYYQAPPPELPYEDGMAIPPGYRKVERTRRGLTISGSIVFGISYGVSLSIAMGTLDTGDDTGWLAIPVAGPFIMSSTLECDPIGEFGCSNSSTRTLLIFDGIAQLTGAVLLTLGFSIPKEVLVPDYSDVRIAPTRIGQNGYGVGAIGRF